MKALVVLATFLSSASAYSYGDGYPPYNIKYPGQTCKAAGESHCFGRFQNWKFQIPAARLAAYNACVADVPRKCRLSGHRD